MLLKYPKYSASGLAVFFLITLSALICLFQIRREGVSYRNTDWDALGYYLYTPALAIHGDPAHLDWYNRIEAKYHLQGGAEFYQFPELTKGKRVGKYFVGVALMQSPFFFLAHIAAPICGFPADGFSLPYQIAVAIAALVYAGIALLLLRKVLLRFFPDATVAIVLMLTFGASNFLQYAAVDCGQVHIYAMFWYAAMAYACAAFYESPTLRYAAVIGCIAGMATLCRPTEIIIILIPLFWGAGHPSMQRQRKSVFSGSGFIVAALIGGVVALSPQILYWKHCTGSWVYDVGSKWDFLQPHLRVLWGEEKGWFIYTPVSILFVWGLGYMRSFIFCRAILIYFILNIWIVTAWSDWLYGGSFSARALVQALPACAFSIAALIQRWKHSVLLGSIAIGILVPLNLFQIEQYNRQIIDYKANNFKYYGAIFGRLHPDVLAYGLLDGNAAEPMIGERSLIFQDDSSRILRGDQVLRIPIHGRSSPAVKGYRIDFRVRSQTDSWNKKIRIKGIFGTDTIAAMLRVQQPYFSDQKANAYAVYLTFQPQFYLLEIDADDVQYRGILDSLRIQSVN